MATGDDTALDPFPRPSQTRREGIPHRSGGPLNPGPVGAAGGSIIAKEHGRTPAGDAQEVRPSTEARLRSGQTARWQMLRQLTLKYQHGRGRGTFGAHHIAICPELARTAEISAAGQAACRV